MGALRIERYEANHKSLWDDFVRQSKNGTFLFCRDYMDYHADRFEDHSLLFFEDAKLVALLAANFRDQIVVSHGGLTYGGMICGPSMKTSLMLELFEALTGFLRQGGFTQLIYKAVPHIYHRIPAEEDLYALFVNRAELFRRDISAAILMEERLPLSKGRKSEIKKAAHLSIRESDDFDTFMEIESAVLLERHNKKPVHTAMELKSLARAFPNNIKLFAAHNNEEMVGGIVMYVDAVVAHAQYISATAEGKRTGAQDAILNHLINDVYLETKYFDFGISTENDGHYLNAGLQQNKESYGARAVAYDFYKLDLADISPRG
jgi:GNAT acetyltransferase-like protein